MAISNKGEKKRVKIKEKDNDKRTETPQKKKKIWGKERKKRDILISPRKEIEYM